MDSRLPNTKQAENKRLDLDWSEGMRNATLASFFLGWAPVLGKIAYQQGISPFTLATFRTLVAVAVLWIGYAVFWRGWLRITWREFVGCFAIGAVNGVGSLLYYSGLSRLDASLASFLNTLYLLWAVLFFTASGQPVRWLTLMRMGLAIGGVYVLTGVGSGAPDWLGAMLMVASAATYGLHLVLAQWVLADVPSRTATPYIILAMACTVGLARALQGGPIEHISLQGWYAIVALGVTTVLSRLLMFAGLRKLGGIESALVNLLELVVSLGLAFLFLGERLTLLQWAGGVVLIVGVLFGERPG